MERLAALVSTLASECRSLYRTKLQKAAFFCDFLACERLGRSISGVRYAHATYGPKMDDGDSLLEGIERSGVIEIREQDNGEVIIPAGTMDNPLSESEMSLIAEVADFVNTFPTATTYPNSLIACQAGLTRPVEELSSTTTSMVRLQMP